MKLTTEQKKVKFNDDLEQLGKSFNVIKSYENTYQIVINLGDFTVDYYSSTETWVSRCSGEKMRGNNKNDLISLLKKMRSDDASDFMKEALDKAKEHNNMLIERFVNLQQKAHPKGILEKVAFWLIRKRGYKVIK